MIFDIKKFNNFDPYTMYVDLLRTNIPVQLITGFVVQGHI